MADMLTEYKPNRPLRSLGLSQLEIPRVHTKQGESAFSYYAARSWNQLPEKIKCAKTLPTFKSSLKTHLQWVRKVFRPPSIFHSLLYCSHLLKSFKFIFFPH